MRFTLRTLHATLALALFAVTLLPGVAGASSAEPSLDPTEKLHPLLQYGAQAEPSRVVRVIVQKKKADVKASDLAARVPGLTVVEEFGVLPAFVADIAQGDSVTLAASPNVRYISPDGPLQALPDNRRGHTKPAKQELPKQDHGAKRRFDSSRLVTTFPVDTHASDAWQLSGDNVATGSKIAVAVIDSGVDASHPDLAGQVVAVNVNRQTQSTGDGYGHGTHVAGIINSHEAARHYLGIAPDATLISVKVADDNGAAYESDLLRGLDWVHNNQDAYKIRALNLSVSVSIPESYATSPVDAAVERLWIDGVTVVASAGNLGQAQDAVWYAPGNDPMIITVGCLDDNGTAAVYDDSLCPISSRGVTEDGFAKPDLVAPGRKILSALSSGVGSQGATLAGEFPERVTSDGHIRLSGTSMSAPMVTGAVALLLDRKDSLTPDQIKKILTSTATPYPGQLDQAGSLNIIAALAAAEHPPATKATAPVPVTGATPAHNAVTVVWDGARWGNAFFDGARWGSAYWDGARWGSSQWDGARWGSSHWDGARWGNGNWD